MYTDILTTKEAEDLVLHNASFPHSYLVVNSKEKIHFRQLTRSLGKEIQSSESTHLEYLNGLFPDAIDFSKTEAEKAILHDRKLSWKKQNKLNVEHNART